MKNLKVKKSVESVVEQEPGGANFFLWLWRLVAAFILFPILTVFWSLIMLLGSPFGSVSFKSWVVGAWAKSSCLLFGVGVRVRDREKLASLKGQGFLVVFNHSSHMDILVLASAFPAIRFGAKIELFRIPVFAMAMKIAGMLPIARDNIDAAIEVYRSAAARAKRGECFGLAPEGTRQESDDRLGEFKLGPFVFAIEAEVPIVPMILKGSSRVLPKGSLVPNTKSLFTQVELLVLEPIRVDGFHYENRHQLKDMVRAKMLKAF